MKRGLALATDAGLCIATVWLAFSLRLGEWISLSDPDWHPEWAAFLSIAIALPIFIQTGFYRAIFRYAGHSAISPILRPLLFYGLIYAIFVLMIGLPGVPRTVGVIQPLLLLLSISGSRALTNYCLTCSYQNNRRNSRSKVLIYGAGASGVQLSAALEKSQEMKIVGFLDDDENLQGNFLSGLPIHHPSHLSGLLQSEEIDLVLLAMPSITRRRRNEILQFIRGFHVAVRTLPSMSDLVNGKLTVSDVHELDIDDLLGRETVAPDPNLLHAKVTDKVVIVTGAGGSIGSELCRQIFNLKPRVLLLLEQSEFVLYQIHHELEAKLLIDSEVKLVPLLGSVRDESRMLQIMKTWRPDTIYHAAAYKHVPLVQHNVVEGIRNNVFGTLAVASAAIEACVSDFVLISTDKAVRPTNVMGGSKRLAEMVLQALTPVSAERGLKTRLSMVRFGNVLGSSGSVVPKFREQIKAGGPITITHPEVTRYFMSIPEAAQLVIQAGSMAEGGDVFLLDMGDPVKILDLACRMVELSGLTVCDLLNPEGEIEIQTIGLRPGEKLYEELLISDNPMPTGHPRIMKAHEDFLPWHELIPELDKLDIALSANDIISVSTQLERLVSGYQAIDKIVDWVHEELISVKDKKYSESRQNFSGEN